MSKIAVLTSGGDSPGMNAAVMAIAKFAARYGMPLVGIKRGYNGLLRKSTSIYDDMEELHLDTVLDIADRPVGEVNGVGDLQTVDALQTVGIEGRAGENGLTEILHDPAQKRR